MRMMTMTMTISSLSLFSGHPRSIPVSLWTQASSRMGKTQLGNWCCSCCSSSYQVFNLWIDRKYSWDEAKLLNWQNRLLKISTKIFPQHDSSPPLLGPAGPTTPPSSASGIANNHLKPKSSRIIPDHSHGNHDNDGLLQNSHVIMMHQSLMTLRASLRTIATSPLEMFLSTHRWSPCKCTYLPPSWRIWRISSRHHCEHVKINRCQLQPQQMMQQKVRSKNYPFPTKAIQQGDNFELGDVYVDIAVVWWSNELGIHND